MALLRSGLSVTPEHEFIEHCDLVVGDAAKDVGEPGLRIDAAELCRLDQGIGDGRIRSAWPNTRLVLQRTSREHSRIATNLYQRRT